MSYFYNYIKNLGDKEINIYVDMDGVVADYDVIGYEERKNNKDIYLSKRPVMTTINVLKEIATLNNVNIYILSVARNNNQIDGKLLWIDENMNFIKKENINILPREKYGFKKAHELKKDFLKDNTNNNSINIMIDDSHQVLDAILSLNMNIIPLHITSILD